MNENNFFNELEKNGVRVTAEQKAKIVAKLSEILNYEPRVGIFGKTGVGKSSLCNALFGKKIFEINDIEACTRNAQEVILGMESSKGIKLIDVPGVGESSNRDIEYSKLYSQLLPELDLVLWLIKADDRAMSSDEMFYKNIVKPHIEQGKPFFFVINQVDKVEPFREWDSLKHEPGSDQFYNIHRKIESISNFFGIQASKIIPVSANEKYNLTKLVDEIVFALPKEKKITFFKEVDEEFQSEVAEKHVQKSFIEVAGEVIGKIIDRGADIVISIIENGAKFVKGAINFISNIFGW